MEYFHKLPFTVLLHKINQICFIAKQSNALIIGISKSKLDSSVLNSEVVIEGYDVIRMDLLRKGDWVAYYISKSLYNH